MTVNPNNAVFTKIVHDEQEVSISNPLPVNVVLGGGGSGGVAGTEYIEDAVAPTNPSGGIVMAVRRDTLSATEVSADGDVVAVKATNKGQLHVLAEISGGSGDASAANQTAVQADAGADATKVIAVQGVTGGKAVKVDGSAVTQPISNADLTAISGKLPSTLGTKSAATSLAVGLSTEDVAKLGSLTETAPTTDTASSGINGRLQRIAQRATSLISLFPSSIGQKTKSASLAVAIASDDDLHSKLGEVQTTPTANTLLGRLKDLTTGIVLAAGTNLIGKVGIDQTTAGTTNGVVLKDSVGTVYDGSNPVPIDVISGVDPTDMTATNTLLGDILIAAEDVSTPVPVIGFGITPSVSFTRPANITAYATGQLVANSTTAASVVPLQWIVSRANGLSGMVRRARIRKSGTNVTNASFRLHLFKVVPSVATTGDAGTFSTVVSGYSNWIGSIDITVDLAFADGSSGSGIPVNGAEINFVADADDNKIYGLLEAKGAYTPGSGETIQVELEVIQN